MVKRFSIRGLTLAAAAAMALGCPVSGSHAAGTNLLPAFKATPGAKSAQVLPAISHPQPFRQALIVTCNVTLPGATNVCLMLFDKVPAHRVLEIETISCQFTASGAFLFRNRPKLDAAHLLALLTFDTPFSLAAGPFYLTAGETPGIFSGGAAPTDQAFCSIFGKLWLAG